MPSLFQASHPAAPAARQAVGFDEARLAESDVLAHRLLVVVAKVSP